MEEVPAQAFDVWRQSLQRLTSSRAVAQSWRHMRYGFAHRLGQALAGIGENGEPSISGHVVYGVWLEWGLLYVGQTGDAARRLRDLAIGESHHLANTFPPEIWSRVAVVSWPRLPEAPTMIEQFGEQEVGLGLEHRLQAELQPLANASRRKTDGSWRQVDWSASRSRGAVVAGHLDALFGSVLSVWDATASSAECRVVSPVDLL